MHRLRCSGIFQNVRQKMPVCQTKCLTKIFRPKKNISSSGTRSLQKMVSALPKQNTNVKKSRFGGGTSSKQSKIQSKLQKVIISTRLEIRRAVAGIWMTSDMHLLSCVTVCDRDLPVYSLTATTWSNKVYSDRKCYVIIVINLCVTKVKIISSIVCPPVHPSVMLCFGWHHK